MALRIIFMGTPEAAVPSLERLADDGHELLVVTQPPRPAGRGLQLAPSAVAVAARAREIEVIERATLKGEDAVAPLAAFRPDLLVVACFGLILRRRVLDLARLMPVNLHPSLLPRHRGAAPIAWTILAGDGETGITTMRMDEGVDTGDILLAERTAVGEREDAVELGRRLWALGADLMARTVAAAAAGTLAPRAQGEEGATHAPRLTKADGRLDWRESALALDRRVRALAGWPGTFGEIEGETVEILRAEPAAGGAPAGAVEPGTIVRIDEGGMAVATGGGGGGGGVLRILELRPAGKRAMPPAAWARGRRIAPGARWSTVR